MNITRREVVGKSQQLTVPPNPGSYERSRCMTHAEFVVHLRQTYAGLFDPDTSEEAWSLFLTANTGWNELIEEYVRRVEVFLAKRGLLSKLYIRQIEEKWGGLRCYLSPTNGYRPSAEVAAALGVIYHEIAERSYHTCDVCGGAGRLKSNNGCYLTRCNDHIADRRLAIDCRKIGTEL